MATTRRRILGVSAVSAVLVLAGLVGVNQWRATSVQLPPTDASPRQVLEIYLHASKNHDCDLTNALAYDQQERDATWCGGNWWDLNGNPTLLAYKHFGKESYVQPSDSEYGAEECITVDIWQKGGSGFMHTKVPGWDFCLHRTKLGWRVAEEGYP